MRILGAVLVCFGFLLPLGAETEVGRLEILPSSVTLRGVQARQQLLAQAQTEDTQRDWTAKVTWTSENPEIVSIDTSGLLQPVTNGSAVVRAQVDGHEASITVHVQDMSKDFSWGFQQHVIPILTKRGCNSGPCHGATAGKNGLKLTLRGYDPPADYTALTREATARRISLADPAMSLFLLKPTMTTPHGGGKKIDVNSLEYQVLSEWIASGAPGPKNNDPKVVNLRVYPRTATLDPGAQQRLVVRAEYSTGDTADVSRWARYDSTDATVAEVTQNGLVKMTGRGEVAITVSYDTHVIYTRLTVPHDNAVDEKDFERLKVNNYIDELVLKKLRKLRIAPSEQTNDSAFLRRAYLDAAGVLPTAEEVKSFLVDATPNKRRLLIDKLLERPEYADYWAYKWSDLLLVSTNKNHLNRTALWDFYNWIRDSVAENKPWDKFVHDIFSSAGSSRENGALNYFVLHKDTIELAENTTQAFMGQTLTCARCHNHPLEKWTQVQYYRFANLFTRIGIKTGDEPGDSIVFQKDFGDIIHPRLKRPLPPTPLEGEELALDSISDRKKHLADWLASDNNIYFARNIVSRVWANFFARGLVVPSDDLRATNPTSNEELFDALAKDLIDSGYDLKHLIRRIMNSGTYQISSTPNASNQHDKKYYSKYEVKRLPAEVILDALSSLTGQASVFKGYPKGMRALQLPDVQVRSDFLESFGRPPRLVCDVQERSSDPSISQALHVINGETLNGKLRSEGNAISSFLKLNLSSKEILDHLFLSAFSRYPDESEKEIILAELANAHTSKEPNKREVVEDLMWALLTKKEFLFNH